MLSLVAFQSEDPIWRVAKAFQCDPRDRKIDLGIGVYRDEHGHTPLLKSVAEVERRLAAEGATKTYRPLTGNAAFNEGLARLLLGNELLNTRIVAKAQTIGGTGALRVLGELIAFSNSSATIWTSSPGYVNQVPIMNAAGLRTASYPWAERDGALNVSELQKALDIAKPGDLIILQGCCHNPTGIEPTPEDWHEIADFLSRKCLIPVIDIAYQGFGIGLEEDVYGLRCLVSKLDTVLIAASCSKNMGLYCERVGAAFVVSASSETSDHATRLFEAIARRSYSMPPNHGAAIAAELLGKPTLWISELDEMRRRVLTVRSGLAAALEQRNLARIARSLDRQLGMFSVLPLNEDEMKLLQIKYAVYGTPEGRINVAGLKFSDINYVADAICNVKNSSE